MLKIRLEGLLKTMEGLQKIGEVDIAKAPIQKGSEQLKAVLTEYPPYGNSNAIVTSNSISMLKQKPNSKYQRTGKLAAGWKYRTRPYVKSWAAFFENDVPYAPLVQGSGTQIPVHAGFWRTVDESVDMVIPNIMKTFDILIQIELDKIK